jgi:hypothetical protein
LTVDYLVGLWHRLWCRLGVHDWGPPWVVRTWGVNGVPELKEVFVVHCRWCREWAEYEAEG